TALSVPIIFNAKTDRFQRSKLIAYASFQMEIITDQKCADASITLKSLATKMPALFRSCIQRLSGAQLTLTSRSISLHAQTMSKAIITSQWEPMACTWSTADQQQFIRRCNND